MKNELISVIVPIYNVEPYLERCINSIRSQTYTNIEILLVDDGSTDASGKICDKFGEIDSRIVVIHKKNGGLSDARNAGISVAKGQYIGFVDADDYIEKEMYSRLYSAVKHANADIGSCGMFSETEEGVVIRNCIQGHGDVILERKNAYEEFFAMEGMLDPSSCTKLWNIALFNEIQYKVGLRSEDIDLLYRMLDKVDKVVCVNDPLYHYCHRPNSITTQGINKSFFDQVKIVNEMTNFIVCKYPELILPVYAYQLWTCIYVLHSTMDATNGYMFIKEKKEVEQVIRSSKKYYIGNKYIYWWYKVMGYSVCLHIHRLVRFALEICGKFYRGIKRVVARKIENEDIGSV